MIPSVVARTWLAIALTELGEFAEGMVHAKRALAVAEQAEHQLSQVLGWLAIGHLLLRKGEVDGAVGALERGLELCDRWSLRIWRPRVASSLGVGLWASRARRGGPRSARQAVTDVERMRLGVDKAMVLVRLGRRRCSPARCKRPKNGGARPLRSPRLTKKRATKPGLISYRTRKLGRWSAEWGTGGEQIERALQLARACGARPLVAYAKARSARSGSAAATKQRMSWPRPRMPRTRSSVCGRCRSSCAARRLLRLFLAQPVLDLEAVLASASSRSST